MARATALWTNTEQAHFEAADLVREDYILEEILQNVEHIAQTHNHSLGGLTMGPTISVGIDNNAAHNPATVTVAHTADPGTTVMLIGVEAADDKDVATVTWNGSGATLVTNFYANLSGARRVAVYKVNNPTGTHDVVVTMAAGVNGRFGVTILNLIGADTTLGTPVTASANAAGSVTSGSVSGAMLVDFVIMGGSTGGLTVGAGQTVDDGRGSQDANDSIAASAFSASHKLGPGPTTMGWEHNTLGSRQWALVVIPVSAGPSAAQGGPLVLNEIEEMLFRMGA